MGRAGKKKRNSKKKRGWLFPLILLVLVFAAALFYFTRPQPFEKRVVQRMPAPPPPPAKEPGEAKKEKETTPVDVQRKPKEEPPPSRRARMALIIDDGGYSVDKMKGLLGSGRPMTFAVLPNTPHARAVARVAHEQGSQILLHLPMEPRDSDRFSLEKDTVLTGMSREEVEEILRKGLLQVPHVRGVNNHMGSRATEDPGLMRTVMGVLKSEGLFFIDSHTSPRTAGRKAAREAGVAYGSNDRFIDAEKNLQAVKTSIREGMKKAARDGRAILIGHPHPLTNQAIREMIPEIEAAGIQLVFASEVVG